MQAMVCVKENAEKKQHLLQMKHGNSEKRKAKSRDAARVRRSNESDIFRELTELLPLSDKIRATLDKTSVTRLAICYIRLQELIKSELNQSYMAKELDRRLDALYLKAYGGFMAIVGSDGFITYLSENVSLFLGLTQMDIMAQSVYEFVHVSNHEHMHELLLSRDAKSSVECCLMFKCTLTSKGHNVNVKSAGYKVMNCSCFRLAQSNYVMMLYKPLLDPANIEQPLGSYVFVTKHSLDMKFTYADKRLQELLGYSCNELLGQSVYNYVYGTDCAQLRAAYIGLVTKGQTVTGMYRMLTAGGGYVWVDTQSTVIMDPRSQKPDCIVCINFVIGSVEQNQIQMSNVQSIMDVKSPMTPEFILSTSSILDIDNVCDSTTLSVEPVNTSADDINLYDDILFPESEEALTGSEGGANLILQLLEKTQADCSMPVKVRSVSMTPSSNAAAVVPDNTQEMDVSLFAPYIPMDSDEDMLFPQVNDLLTMPPLPDNRMLGITESVFGPRPEEPSQSTTATNLPIGILRLSSLKKNRMLLGDAAQNIGMPRIKQTVETNRLSTGPPRTLRPAPRASASVCGMEGSGTVPDSSSSSSAIAYNKNIAIRNVHGVEMEEAASGGSTVLRNLLLNGADAFSGYSIRPEITNGKLGPADRNSGVMRRSSNLWSLLMGHDA